MKYSPDILLISYFSKDKNRRLSKLGRIFIELRILDNFLSFGNNIVVKDGILAIIQNVNL